MVMSCRISSYFSSMDKAVSFGRALRSVPRAAGAAPSSVPTDGQSASSSMPRSLLQPVDFFLDGGHVALDPHPPKRAARSRRPRPPGRRRRPPGRAAPARLRLDAREAVPATRPAACPPDWPPAARSAPRPGPRDRPARAAPRPPDPRPAGAPASTAAPARPAAAAHVAGTATAGASVLRWAAAFRISSRTTDSVIRALCASRSANWSRAAASGIVAATVSISSKKLLRLSGRLRSTPAAARSSRNSRYGRDPVNRST